MRKIRDIFEQKTECICGSGSVANCGKPTFNTWCYDNGNGLACHKDPSTKPATDLKTLFSTPQIYDSNGHTIPTYDLTGNSYPLVEPNKDYIFVLKKANTKTFSGTIKLCIDNKECLTDVLKLQNNKEPFIFELKVNTNKFQITEEKKLYSYSMKVESKSGSTVDISGGDFYYGESKATEPEAGNADGLNCGPDLDYDCLPNLCELESKSSYDAFDSECPEGYYCCN